VARFADWCGFLGAWLLFAGPVYQADTELDAEVRECREFMSVTHTVDLPPPVSAWWWLIPPVGWLLHHRRQRVVREQMRTVLTDSQVAQLVSIAEKATGWALVGGGAGLIAVKETWTLTRAYGWATVVFWLILAAMVVGCVAFTANRARRRNAILSGPAESPA
jgi:hypothetical protein